ncbi:PREDICTED: zona pellucida sperm-binding protein 3-like [Myotis davidii]|uniref:zona pellucida sperm-binding protein 3-like n=1 Tax=Myotis davidii TaxID=225400 RepID=UPI0003EC1632|nr:PREDICTED: zona pellucida sperm-binding protein 3-like [Myotis davidii]
MALSYGLFVCFLLWGGMELCYSQSIWQRGTPHVMVKCLEAQLVVTVSKDLFGTGKLIRPADLTLDPEDCEPLVSMDTDDAVRFEAGLHECGFLATMTEDALVYSTFLLHNPRPVGNLSIVRTNRVEVPIECRFPRQGNVSSHAILPTWMPFRTTVFSEEKLVFSLYLMEESWSSKKRSPTFQLGDIAHLQAEVHTSSKKNSCGLNAVKVRCCPRLWMWRREAESFPHGAGQQVDDDRAVEENGARLWMWRREAESFPHGAGQQVDDDRAVEENGAS